MNLLQKLRESPKLRKVVLPFVAAGMLTGFGCSKSPTDSGGDKPPPPDTGIVYHDNTLVLDSAASQGISGVQANTITFSQPSQEIKTIQVGDVVSFPPSNHFPGGQLVKINYVSQNRDTLRTTQATIDELVKEGRLEFSKTWEPQEVYLIPSEKLVSGKISVLDSDNENYDFMFPFNATLYDVDENPNTTHDQFSLDGMLYANFTTNGWVDFSWFGVDSLYFDIGANQSFKANAAFGENVLNINEEVKLLSIGSVPLPTAVSGVYVSLRGDVYGGIKGDFSDFGITLDQTLNVGFQAKYDGTRWTTSQILDPTLSFIFDPPTDSAQAEVYIKTKPGLVFYETVAPYVAPQVFGQLHYSHFSDPLWSAYAGYKVSAGVDVGIFGFSTNLVDFDLFGDTVLVAQADPIDSPIAHISANPTTGEAPIEVSFDGSSSTSGRPIISYHFDFDDGNSYTETSTLAPDGNFDGKTNYTYTTPGDRWVKLEVEDNLERIATDSVEMRVEEGQSADTLTRLTFDGYISSPVVSVNNQIAYSSVADGDAEIYLINDDGSNKTQLTNNTSFDGYPAFSLDGTQIAYLNVSNGDLHIRIMDLDGTNDSLFHTRSNRDDPTGLTWGSTHFAYSYGVRQQDGSKGYTVIALNAQGQSVWSYSSREKNRDPHWSPTDDSLTGLIYTSTLYNFSNEEIMNIDTNLTDYVGLDITPAYSFDGLNIIFSSNRPTDSSANAVNVWTIDKDGANPYLITTDAQSTFDPYFFPDGERIVFVRDGDVYKMPLPQSVKQ